MLNIEIDGKAVEVEHGSTIIDAADKIGVAIPRFCYHPKLSVAANCRMCHNHAWFIWNLRDAKSFCQ
ncbi:MAG TPA: 2Fe-2S iron-sulfur cluster-binding protein, partial [Methylotenera sp.]|nr:2Fe-2S iron-sulfur cluster-binding protein [Methylotenera sp.]